MRRAQRAAADGGPMPRALDRPALALAVALAVALGPAAPAAGAAARRYVALGDSYSSGTGTRSYVDAACRRSTRAFPYLVAHALPGTTLALAACSGATTRDVLAGQLGALAHDTALVTITVGGNDAGFASVLTACAMPAWMSDCAGRVAAAQAFVRTALPALLDDVYAAIGARAPAARVVVVGYPRLFDGRDCDLATWFSADDERLLNETADLLAAVTRERAAAHGFAFADAIGAFAGHAICDAGPWLNGLTWPIAESFHPSAAGHRLGYAPLVLATLRRTTGAPER
jgi:lysophospholipase L1-like esterase